MLQDNALMTDGIAHLWAHLAESDPMIDAETIQNRVDELAEQINGRYPDGVSIIAVMTGAIPFVADLMRRLTVPVHMSVVVARSYEGDARRAGQLQMRFPVAPEAVTGLDVLVVDDILDSGQTLGALFEVVASHGPRSVAGCVLLRKGRLDLPDRMDVDYVGFDLPDAFVVGYGLDFQDRFRNLPAIYALPE
jgi:hypoxanthine phosphoribosyltransferase